MKTALTSLAKALVALSALLPVEALAFSPVTPYRHVVSSEVELGGDMFIFVMWPDRYEFKKNDWVLTGPPSGVAYQLSQSGSMKKLWSVKGWYAYVGNVLLSPDGRTLLRIREETLWNQRGLKT